MAELKRRKKKPAPPPTSDREALISWWHQRMQEVEREHAQRIEILRTVGEHPSPVFAQQVRMFGALGLPPILVAKLLQIDPATLLHHYGDEYELGTAEVINSVAANMLRIATTLTDSAAARVGMEILSRRGGDAWRPPAQKLNLIDDREPKNVIDSSQLSVEDRQKLREILTRQLNGESPEPLQLSQEEAS